MEQYQNNVMNDNMQLQEAIGGIRQAVQGEREDELFYDYLISQAPTSEEKEIIGSIRDDERRHNRIFRSIYEEFTGERLPTGEEEEFEVPESYLDGIRKALFGELRAVEKYRAIRRRLPEGSLKDILFDIITDELKHASKYNYLFTLNSTMGNLSNEKMNYSIITGSGMRMDTTSANNTNSTINSTTTPTSKISKITPIANVNTSTDTASFTPDDWVRYIEPLVTRALTESREGINPEHLYQEFILAGVLVGLGKKPQDAIEQVEDWEKTGTSKLLAMSKMSRYFNFQD